MLGDALIDTVGALELTVTVVDWLVLPPLPVQESVYVVVAVSAPVLTEPLVASLPLQPPDAVQLVALVADQVRVELPPLATVVGLALKDSVGAGALTVTVVDCAAVPPVPLHFNVNLVVLDSAPVDCDPLVASVPDQPPEAVQLVACFDDQVSVLLDPFAIVLGLELMVTVGAGWVTDTVTDCMALPPGPLHSST